MLIELTKYKFISTVFFIVLFCLKSQGQSDSVVRYFYTNGALMSEGTLVDGRPDGFWRNYYESGVLKSEGNRKAFQLDSIWSFYNDSGQIVKSITYKEGKLHGESCIYATNKQKVHITTYDSGVIVDTVWCFYSDGGFKFFIPYKEGKRWGQGIELLIDSSLILSLYERGNLVSSETLNKKDKGGLKVGKWVFYDDYYVIRSECSFRRGLKHGVERLYKPNGELEAVNRWLNGVLLKPENNSIKFEIKRAYDSYGNIVGTGLFDSLNRPVGVHRKLDSTGNVVSSKTYVDGILASDGVVLKNGLKNGSWLTYYPSGQLKSKGAYKNGLKIGEWIYYYDNDSIEQIGRYNDMGKQDGEWIWFYETGDTLRKETYYDGLEEGWSYEYTDSGSVAVKGAYKDGMRQGRWDYWIGDHYEYGNYVDDLESGEWRGYYNNEQITFKGSYQNGLEYGQHLYWYENGFMKMVGEYQAGNRIGDWRFYNNRGELILIITYENGLETHYNGYRIDPPNFQID